MPRSLTAQDRSALIRLASSLPPGSPERRAILGGLSKASGDSQNNARSSVASGEVGPKLSADIASHDAGDEVGSLAAALAKWGADVVAVYLRLPVDMDIRKLPRKMGAVQKALGTITPAQAYERNDNLLLKAIRSAGLDLSR